MCEKTLNKLLANSRVEKKSAYTTGQVALILNVSVNTVLMMTDGWTETNKRGLECYRAGTHRRIPHHTLIDWLTHNTQTNLEGQL